jgi:MFS family permease
VPAIASDNDCSVNSDLSQGSKQQVSLLPIFLIVLVDVLGLTIVLPLLPVYGESFGASALVAAFLSPLGMSVPLYCAAGLSFTSIVCTMTLLPRDAVRAAAAVPEQQLAAADLPAGRRLGLLDWGRYVGYLKRPVLGGVLAEFFFYQMAFSMFISGFALFAERRFTWHEQPFTPYEIGLLFAFSGFLGIIVQGGLLGRAVRIFREPRLVAMGLWSMAAGYALLGYVEPVAPLLVAVALASIGNSVLRPSLTSIVTQVVPDAERGVALGLMQSLASLASISAAPISGWLIDHQHLTSWGWFAAACCGMALLVRHWGSAAHHASPAAA